MGGRGGSSASSRMTVQERAEMFAAGQVSNVEDINPLEIDYLPSFIQDKLSEAEYYAASTSSNATIERETERAVLIRYETDYGNVKVWSPRSVIRSPEEIADRQRRTIARQEVNSQYTQYLRNLARSSGLRIGNTRRWNRLQSMLEDAGVLYMNRDDYANSHQ